MLVSFEVSGFKSIKDNILIEFSAFQGQRIKNTKYENNFFKNRLAKSIVLFGTNATGKTNLLQAIANIFSIIKNGINLEKEKEKINKFSNQTRYKVEILIKKTLYSYELEFNSEKILKETLYIDDKIFYEFKTKNNKVEFFSNYEKIRSFKELLSVESKNTILNKIKDNIQKELYPLLLECFITQYFDNINLDDFLTKSNEKYIIPFFKYRKDLFEKHKNKILDLLHILDDSIDDFIFTDIKEERFSLALKRGEFETGIENESSGIKKIVYIMDSLILDMMNGGTFIIDELDSSISTISLIKILNGVINSSENTKGQFIFSSHNPLIFDTDMLAPSQIYIVGKENSSTTIRCLGDYDLRNDKRKAYLNYLRGDYA